jgi:O-acetyl-ADP-ribose deacetylase (regulator of RNase III)
MSIQMARGDLLKQSDVDAIVNTVNCVGVMGKGIALQFRNKWPENARAYERACKAGKVRPGTMFIFDLGGLVKPNFIINFPTKDHWRGKSKLEFIESGLVALVEEVKRLQIRSIAVPPLGCGNGGLSWSDVRQKIQEAFAKVPDVEVRLFEPAGAPDAKSMEVRTKRPNMTRGRAAVLRLLAIYKTLNHGVSRLEVQKLAYFLQAAGEDLNLSFEKNEYGPYSDALRHVLNKIEGHFIRGVGDGVVESEIEPDACALAEASDFLASADDEMLNSYVDRVATLIDGFQTPYGMELLATVHWVVTQENCQGPEEAAEAVARWNDRKRMIMPAIHVSAAWERLSEGGWFHPERVPLPSSSPSAKSARSS